MPVHAPHDEFARLRYADLPVSVITDAVSTARRGYLRITAAAAGPVTAVPALCARLLTRRI